MFQGLLPRVSVGHSSEHLYPAIPTFPFLSEAVVAKHPGAEVAELGQFEGSPAM